MTQSEHEKALRELNAFCRGCDDVIKKGDEMVTTYSFRNRGQSIHFCLHCAVVMGELATGGNDDAATE